MPQQQTESEAFVEEKRAAQLISDAAEASELFGDDLLEEHAKNLREAHLDQSHLNL